MQGIAVTITDLLTRSRSIWGARKQSLESIIVCMGVVFGDICRWQRDRPMDDAELRKELGNIILSTIRWCDDLGYDPEECIRLALDSQQKFIERMKGAL
jgi:hypothetical protein